MTPFKEISPSHSIGGLSILGAGGAGGGGVSFKRVVFASAGSNMGSYL